MHHFQDRTGEWVLGAALFQRVLPWPGYCAISERKADDAFVPVVFLWLSLQRMNLGGNYL